MSKLDAFLQQLGKEFLRDLLATGKEHAAILKLEEELTEQSVWRWVLASMCEGTFFARLTPF
jgi:hypothetical protein